MQVNIFDMNRKRIICEIVADIKKFDKRNNEIENTGHKSKAQNNRKITFQKLTKCNIVDFTHIFTF